MTNFPHFFFLQIPSCAVMLCSTVYWRKWVRFLILWHNSRLVFVMPTPPSKVLSGTNWSLRRRLPSKPTHSSLMKLNAWACARALTSRVSSLKSKLKRYWKGKIESWKDGGVGKIYLRNGNQCCWQPEHCCISCMCFAIWMAYWLLIFKTEQLVPLCHPKTNVLYPELEDTTASCGCQFISAWLMTV